MFPADQEETLVEFIYTRLSGKAETGIKPNLTTVEEVAEDIKSRCEEKIEPSKIIANMKALKTKDTKSLCNEIEELTEKLKVLYLQKKIPTDVASELAVKEGIDSLIEKVSNREAKTALIIGKFATINEATKIVNECESRQDKAHILAYQGSINNRNNNRGYQNRNNQNNYGPNPNQPYRNYYNNRNNNSFNNRNNNNSNYNNNQRNNIRYNNRFIQGYNNERYNSNYNGNQNKPNKNLRAITNGETGQQQRNIYHTTAQIQEVEENNFLDQQESTQTLDQFTH